MLHPLPPDPVFISCIYGTEEFLKLQLRGTQAPSVNCPVSIEWERTRQLFLCMWPGDRSLSTQSISRLSLIPAQSLEEGASHLGQQQSRNSGCWNLVYTSSSEQWWRYNNKSVGCLKDRWQMSAFASTQLFQFNFKDDIISMATDK